MKNKKLQCLRWNSKYLFGTKNVNINISLQPFINTNNITNITVKLPNLSNWNNTISIIVLKLS